MRKFQKGYISLLISSIFIMNNILKVKLFYNVNFLMIKQVEENKSKKKIACLNEKSQNL